MSLELRFEGRQSLSMSHREREIVPDVRTDERRVVLSLELFTEHRRCECQQRSRECMMGCTVLGCPTDKEEQKINGQVSNFLQAIFLQLGTLPRCQQTERLLNTVETEKAGIISCGNN